MGVGILLGLYRAGGDFCGADATSRDVETVRAVQRALREAAASVPASDPRRKALDPGLADGVVGARTIAAVRAFQASSGREPTGRIDDWVLRALGVPASPPPLGRGAAYASQQQATAALSTTAPTPTPPPSEKKKRGRSHLLGGLLVAGSAALAGGLAWAFFRSSR